MPANNVKREDLCASHKPILPPNGLYPSSPSISSIVNQSMPMAAMFLRNKFIAWFSLLQSIHSLLNTSTEQLNNNKTNNSNNVLDQSPLLKICFCIVGLVVSYLNLIFPQQSV
ncbi:hypothetical protein MOSE0_H01530 [Monosporozyma servazzii]